MKLTDSISTWLDHRLNPVVFKEYTLLVRSRSMLGLWSATGLLPLIVTCFILPFYARNMGWGPEPGFITWSFSFGVLMALGCGGMITLAMRSLSSEREAGTYDLLACSPMEPLHLIWGKWQAVMIFALFGFAAFLPFASAAYLLGGVDLIALLLSIVLGIFAFGFAAAAGLYMALSGKPGLMQTSRMSVMSLLGSGLGIAFSMLLAAIHQSLLQGTGAITHGQLMMYLSIILLLTGSCIYFIIISSAAHMTLATLNPAGMRRQASLRALGIVIITAGALYLIHPVKADIIVLIIFLFICAKIVLFWETMIDAAKAGRVTRRMALKWRSTYTLPGRTFSFLALARGLLAIDIVAAPLLLLEKGTDVMVQYGILTQITLYMLVYTVIAALICKRFPRVKPGLAIVLLVAFGSLGSSFLLILFSQHLNHTFHPLYLISPAWWISFIDDENSLLSGVMWSSALAAIPVFYIAYLRGKYFHLREELRKLREDSSRGAIEV